MSFGVRVVAPTRLHFGLLHVPVDGFTRWPDGTPVRKFGGIGLMIDGPTVTVEARRSDVTSVTGSLASRAAAFLHAIRAHEWWQESHEYRITADGPPEHIGLGVGTALGMAVARAVNGVRFGPDCQTNTVKTLAAMVGRGRRSGVGVFGFQFGNLIVDEGKIEEAELPKVSEIVPFPADWRVVLLRPAVNPLWHGDREQTAFGRTRTPAAAAATTDRLRRLAFDGLVPAARSGDFRTFSESVFAYNRAAGEPFAEDQGSLYAGPEVSGIIEELRGRGVTGVGQSSWGPTVFAFAADPAEGSALADRARTWLPSSVDIMVAAASPRGAVVTTELPATAETNQPD